MNKTEVIDSVSETYTQLENCLLLMDVRLRRMEGITNLQILLKEREGLYLVLNQIEDAIQKLKKICEVSVV